MKFLEARSLKKTIINKAERVIIYSENNSVELNFKNPELILDRVKFDNFLANMARKNNVKINLRSKFIGIVDKGNI